MFSRPVLIARDLLSSRICLPGQRHEGCIYLSQVKYCGGYSGDEPPLTIPNREVKLTSADGTAPPGGRVGRCRFSEARSKKFDRASLVRGCALPPREGERRVRGVRCGYRSKVGTGTHGNRAFSQVPCMFLDRYPRSGERTSAGVAFWTPGQELFVGGRKESPRPRQQQNSLIFLQTQGFSRKPLLFQ